MGESRLIVFWGDFRDMFFSSIFLRSVTYCVALIFNGYNYYRIIITIIIIIIFMTDALVSILVIIQHLIYMLTDFLSYGDS